MAHPGFGKAKMQWLEPMRNVSAYRRVGVGGETYRSIGVCDVVGLRSRATAVARP
jgi:hypothetical protein